MRTIDTVALFSFGLMLSACSASSDSGSQYGGGSGGGAAAAAGASGSGGTVDSGTPPDSGSGGDGALPVNPEAASDVVMPDGDTCSAVSVAAEPYPLDMYVMMDQSGSMGAPVNLMQPFGPTQWDAVKDAFVGFLSSSPPTGMAMGIQYFPLPLEPWSTFQTCSGGGCGTGEVCASMDTGTFCMTTCSSDANCDPDGECMSFDDGNGGSISICNNDTCNEAEYGTPEVPVADIPGVNQSIINSLNAHEPMTMTPMRPALAGAIDYMRGYAGQHPGHTPIVVLATDGAPSACSEGAILPINEVYQVASDGVNGSPSIKTFVIGIIGAGGATFTNALHGIAQNGGTNQAFIVQAGQDMTVQFKAALEAIRGAFMQCEFQIPNPGIPMDWDEVNVKYTAPDGSKYTVYYVGDISQCDPVEGGWYYDVDPNVGTPTKILLCPQSCQFMQDHSGSIDIEIGCETITPPK